MAEERERRPVDPKDSEQKPESASREDEQLRIKVPDKTREEMVEEDRFESTDN
jgi:hypothetical protein